MTSCGGGIFLRVQIINRPMNHVDLLKLSEKEIPCRPGYGDTLGMADGPVVGIQNGAVITDVTDSAIAAVLYSSVCLDMADGPVVRVLDGAVGLYVSHGLVIGVGHALGIGLAAEQRTHGH